MKLHVYFFLCTLLLGCNSSDEGYVKNISEIIEGRKRYLKFNENSPFRTANTQYFDPEYFEINKQFRVEAKISKSESKNILALQQSDGSTQRYEQYAVLSFKLGGQPQQLTVYKPVGFGNMAPLFCAFTDLSNGKSTYDGGRYLDIELGKSTKTILDFNLAYNPYCAYVDKYVCPLPPSENQLQVFVEAGERYSKKNID